MQSLYKKANQVSEDPNEIEMRRRKAIVRSRAENTTTLEYTQAPRGILHTVARQPKGTCLKFTLNTSVRGKGI